MAGEVMQVNSKVSWCRPAFMFNDCNIILISTYARFPMRMIKIYEKQQNRHTVIITDQTDTSRVVYMQPQIKTSITKFLFSNIK